MIIPKLTLDNPYYFIQDGTLFQISNTQDKDNCGTHKVTYVTEEKELNVGDSYYDLHGDYVKITEASSSGKYDVKTNSLDKAACASVFPSFTVTYVDKDNKQHTRYYWLQDMIKPGDKFTESFAPHGADQNTTYITLFQDDLKNAIKEMAKKGVSIDSIKKSMPMYCFNVSALSSDDLKKTTMIENGKTIEVTYQSNTLGLNLTDTSLNTLIYEALNEDVVKYANQKLLPYQKKIKPNVKLISSSNVITLT